MKKFLLLLFIILSSSIVLATPDLKGGSLVVLTDTYVEYQKTVPIGDPNLVVVKLIGTDLINRVNNTNEFYYDNGVIRISPAFEVDRMEIYVPRNLSGSVFTMPTLYHCDDLDYNETTKICNSGWDTFKVGYEKVVTPVNTGIKLSDIFPNTTMPSWVDIPNYTVSYVPNFKMTKNYDMFFFKSVNSTYTVGAGQNYTTITACLIAVNNTGDTCNIVVNGTYVLDGNDYMWYKNTTTNFIDIQADDVTLDCNGSVFKSNLSGIAIYAANNNNNSIFGCNLTGFDEGISFNTIANASVHDNVFSIFDTGGSYSYNGLNVIHSPNVYIYNNFFYVPLNASNFGGLSTQNRLYVYDSDFANVTSNVISGGAMEVRYCDNATVENNVLKDFGVGFAEMTIEDSHDSVVRGNVVNNTIGLLGGIGVQHCDNTLVENNVVENNFVILGLIQNENNLKMVNNDFKGTPDAWYMKNVSDAIFQMFGLTNCTFFANMSGQNPKICGLSFAVMFIQSLGGFDVMSGNISNVNLDLSLLTGGAPFGAVYAKDLIGLNFTQNLLQYDGFGFYVDIDVDNVYFVNDFLGIGISAASFDVDNSIIYNNDFIMKDSGLDFNLHGNTTLLKDTGVSLQLSPVSIYGDNNSFYDNVVVADSVLGILSSDSLVNITGENFVLNGVIGGMSIGSTNSFFHDNQINLTNSGINVNLDTQDVNAINLTITQSGMAGVIFSRSGGPNDFWDNSIVADTLGVNFNINGNNVAVTDSSLNNVFAGLLLFAYANDTSVWNNTGVLDNLGILINMNGSISALFDNVDLSDNHFGLVTFVESDRNYLTTNDFTLGDLALVVPFSSPNPVATNIFSQGSSFAFYNLVSSDYNNITYDNVTGQAISPIHITGLTNNIINSNVLFIISSAYIDGYSNDISHNVFENTLNGSFRDLAGVNSTIDIIEAGLFVGGNNNNIHANEFDDANSNLENYSFSLVNLGINNVLLKNHFLNGRAYDTNSSQNTYCVAGEGNFYRETIAPIIGDCGPIGTVSAVKLNNNFYNVTWGVQSSDGKLIKYSVNQEGYEIAVVNSTSRILNFAGVNHIEIIPFYEGSRVNGTHALLTYIVPTEVANPFEILPEAGAGIAIFLNYLGPALFYLLVILILVCVVSMIAFSIFRRN